MADAEPKKKTPWERVGSAKGSASSSPSAPSSKHSAGASKVAAQASRFLADVLASQDDVTVHQQRDIDRYLQVIEKQRIHRIQDTDNPETFIGSPETWQLICLAAKRSSDAYSLPNSEPDFVLKPGFPLLRHGAVKRTLVSTRPHTDGKVMIVAVRGSTNKMMDWLVNCNAETTMAPEVGCLLEPHEFPNIPAEWHKGFLAVAQDMKDRILRAIDNALPATATAGGSTDAIHLLFTGHSAGGAVAKLLYAMSASQDPNMSRVIARFRSIHCIVFGAPPVATVPIRQPAMPSFQSGLFLSFVNEGDPVALIQPEYFKSLIIFLTHNASEVEKKYPPPDGFTLPDPILRVSGSCVVLRDIDCDDVEVEGWDAVAVPAEKLEAKLFGNIAMHGMKNYLERVQSLRGL
ncbi:Alpha/Beta hydrolase protein [Chaetomium fimeti]|uniref:Alpha/Beta hydrolase protein n=1 Tax=Chaetomium fimeti TaxID=1854472 RepID=A0AAE0H906_9PEZI|nr:Alpha/Beta hydrolase protein [Chaetomium fimeti]